METIQMTLQSKAKPKQKVIDLAGYIQQDPGRINELKEYADAAKDSEKGACLSALALISKDHPEYMKGHIQWIVGLINHKAPRVKWESSEIIANISPAFPEEAKKGIPYLMKNVHNEGTVVKWSAAYGLTEIAKYNPKTRKELVPFFEKVIKKETNNGVKNVYLKAMKWIEKQAME